MLQTLYGILEFPFFGYLEMLFVSVLIILLASHTNYYNFAKRTAVGMTLCSHYLFHMPDTRPDTIMLYQLSGMLGLTRKNALVFLTTSKTGPKANPSLLLTPHCFLQTQILFPY